MQYRRAPHAVIGILTMGGISVLLAGCDTPAVQKARHAREGALARSAQMVGTLDKHRSDKLARTGAIMAEKQRRNEEGIRSDMDEIARLLEQEFETWEEKQPGFRRAIGHQLEGDAASIERTAPRFVY